MCQNIEPIWKKKNPKKTTLDYRVDKMTLNDRIDELERKVKNLEEMAILGSVLIFSIWVVSFVLS